MERNARRRWVPRFSLRTLVVGVLFLGSGGLVWWDWGAWAPSLMIEVPGELLDVEFVGARDEFITAKLKTRGLEAGEVREERIILDARTGKRLPWSEKRHLLPSVSFSETGKYCRWAIIDRPFVLTRVADGGEINVWNALGPTKTYTFSPRDGFLTVIAPTGNARLLRMPGLEVVREFGKPGAAPDFVEEILPRVSNDETWTAEVKEDAVEIANLEPGAANRSLAYWGKFENLLIAPTSDKVAILSEVSFKLHVRVFEVKSGKLVADLNFVNQSRKPRGPRKYLHQVEFSDNGNFLFVRKIQMTGNGAIIGEALSMPEIFALELNGLKVQLTGANNASQVKATGDTVLGSTTSGTTCWDLHSGAIKWERRDEVSCDKSRRFGTTNWGGEVIDMQTGETLFETAGYRWSHWVPKGYLYSLSFAPHSSDFLMRSELITKRTSQSDVWDKHAVIWRQRRPIEWWGCFWMWEFWMAMVFAVGLGWSVWGDRRGLAGRVAG